MCKQGDRSFFQLCHVSGILYHLILEDLIFVPQIHFSEHILNVAGFQGPIKLCLFSFFLCFWITSLLYYYFK